MSSREGTVGRTECLDRAVLPLTPIYYIRNDLYERHVIIADETGDAE